MGFTAGNHKEFYSTVPLKPMYYVLEVNWNALVIDNEDASLYALNSNGKTQWKLFT